MYAYLECMFKSLDQNAVPLINVVSISRILILSSTLDPKEKL